MEPGSTSNAESEILRIRERNAFYESLSGTAKERFLETLTQAQARGLDEEAAWREAVVAAELAYEPEGAAGLATEAVFEDETL